MMVSSFDIFAGQLQLPMRPYKPFNVFLIFIFFTSYFSIPYLFPGHFDSLETVKISIKTSKGHSNKFTSSSYTFYPRNFFDSLKLVFRSQPLPCTPPNRKYIESGQERNRKLPLLDKIYDWDELWLSNTSAALIVNAYGKFGMEKNRKTVGIADLKTTLANLNPKSVKLFHEKIWCKKCIVVGSGGCLRDKNLGSLIDSFPVVIRMNKPPLKYFRKTVGRKTDVRFLYPESAPSHSRYYKGQSFAIVVPFKKDDYLWAATMANRSLKLNLRDFWSFYPPPKRLSVKSKKILVVNPNITEYLHSQMKTRATTGLLSIILALNFCESVTIAGFCYNSSSTFTYYYGSQRMELAFKSKNHSPRRETKKIAQLARLKYITDLTGSMV